MRHSILLNDVKGKSFWKGLIIPILLFVCLMLSMFIGIRNVSAASDKESRDILQDAVLRTTVQCYAIEGMYPPNIEYLEEHYGLVFDRDRFIIHYEVFAGNIPPDITVIDLSE
jgi:hypothetical protein